jgi:phosphoserine phosphatase
MGHTTKTELKQRFFLFVRDIADIDAHLKCFWDAHIGNINEWYKKTRRCDDVIISASPDFLLRPACDRLGIKTLIASPVDKYTGSYSGLNCDGDEKAKRFKQQFPNGKPDSFYSDSDSDLPMARLARVAYKVKGSEIYKWDL